MRVWLLLLTLLYALVSAGLHQHNQIPLKTAERSETQWLPSATARFLQRNTSTPTAESTATVTDTPVPTPIPTMVVATPTPMPVEAPAPLAFPQGLSGTPQDVLITFYYCERTVVRPDDGGGYCGTTRMGTQVHPGTAACATNNLGRSFSIKGDPSGLIYTCEDTGSGVGSAQVDIWFYTNGEGWNWPLLGYGTIVWQD